MEINSQRLGDILDVKVKGRLDGYWADHLKDNLEELIRGGAHRILLNLSGVSYLSSAGIGLLVHFHKKLNSIDGSFVIASPSEPVKRVLDLCGLSVMLLTAAPAPVQTVPPAAVRHLSAHGAEFEIEECSPGASLGCRVIGDPELLSSCRFREEHCYALSFPESTFALGLGAFGHSFEDAQARFGEFLAVAGSAAYLPTDGTNVPDFMVSTGALVPEISVLYGIRCEGGFSHLARFEAKNDAGAVALSELVETCLEISGGRAAGIVMVAESAGLVGAALRRSPAMAATDGAPFQYPEVRKWLSFTTERLYSRSLALISGVATRAESKPLDPMLRPIGTDSWPRGHFHAAAFSYRPLKKGSIALKNTVTTLFETESLQGVLHLLSDNRETAGIRQSEFVRGAFWIGTIPEITAEGK
jgi:anti-anti-sigma factor